MTTVKKWALPGLTVLMVLAAIVLPQQLSSLRDLKTLDTIHTQPLSEDDLAVRELPLPEKLALLARAIRYPDLEVYSTTQSLPVPGQPGADQAEAAFFQGIDCLADWGVLPESFDPDTLEFQSGSRAVYVEADSGQSVSMLYLQGENDSRDNFWLVVDEETGLPVWIDCSLRSVKQDLLSSEELGTRFLEGLGVQTRQRGPAMWEVEESGGVVYCALTEASYGRICVELLGFADALFGQGNDSPSPQPK